MVPRTVGHPPLLYLLFIATYICCWSVGQALPQDEGQPGLTTRGPSRESTPVEASLQPTSLVQCRDFHTLPNISDVCQFVTSTPDCDVGDGVIDYTRVVFCTFTDNVGLGVFVFFIWWFILFITLATSAKEFFCPSLIVISKTLRMPPNISGVTFLAFGNGAPDIFSSIAAVSHSKNGEAGLAFGALLGGGMFVTTVVASAVSFTKSFHAMERPFLRDIIFYLAALFWTFWILYHGVIYTSASLGFVGLYVFYVIVVLLGRWIHQQQKLAARQGTTPKASPCETTIVLYNRKAPSLSLDDDDDDDDNEEDVNEEDDLHAETTLGGVQNGDAAPQQENIADEGTPLLSPDRRRPQFSARECARHGREFLTAMNPVDLSTWPAKRRFYKAYDIFKAPMKFVLILTIPLVDYDKGVNNNWNKYLNALHCVSSPLFAVFAAKPEAALHRLNGVFPVYALLILACFGLALLVLATSEHDTPPAYHCVFAYVAFVTAVIWIYFITHEIVHIMQMFGIVFNISDAVLGLTLLSWGNSIGDLVADTAMARKGFPRTGISACFGGPLFNLLLGIGIPFTIVTVKNGGHFHIQFTLIQCVLTGFLAVSLLTSLVTLVAIRFNVGRLYGAILLTIYALFLTVALLAESGTIPSPKGLGE